MRNAPLNYLLAVILGGVFWLAAAMGVGSYLGTNLPLLNATVEEFLGMYRVLVGIGMVVSVALACWWFFLGSRPKASVQLDRARKLWRSLFFLTVALNVLALFGIVIVFRSESFGFVHHATFVGVFALNTWLLFWIATLAGTPRTWMNTVPGRR